MNCTPENLFTDNLDKLSQIERHLYLFLAITPEGHFSGLYQLPVRRIEYWTGIQAKTIKKHLRSMAPTIYWSEPESFSLVLILGE